MEGRVHVHEMDSMEEEEWRGSSRRWSVRCKRMMPGLLRLASEAVECSGVDASSSSCVCSGSWRLDHCPCPSPRMWRTAVTLSARSKDPLENCN